MYKNITARRAAGKPVRGGPATRKPALRIGVWSFYLQVMLSGKGPGTEKCMVSERFRTTHEKRPKVAKRDEHMEGVWKSVEPICPQLSPRKRPLPRILFGSEVSARRRTCGSPDHGASADAAVYCDTARATHERRQGCAVTTRTQRARPHPNYVPHASQSPSSMSTAMSSVDSPSRLTSMIF